MTSARSTSVATIAVLTVVGGLVAYAVYFDYKRRNDPTFRKKLRKSKRRAEKVASESTPDVSSSGVPPEELREALQQIKQQPLPTKPEELESLFMSQISMGEGLAVQGPSFYLQSALCFYRALSVYPAPLELIVIYQKTLQPPVFEIVTQLMNMDMKNKVEGYFQFFPPKSCSVSLKHSEGGLIVTADRDFKAGDVIYKEYPVASVLDPDLTIRGTHCSRCLCELADSGVAAVRTDDAFPAAYCSEDCATAARVQYEALLFSLESALPPSLNLGPPASATAREARRVAQEKYIEYVQAHPEHANASVLVARFIARQATAETEKLVAKAISAERPKRRDDDYTDAEGSDESYSLEEHLVRLRFTLPEGAHVEQEGTLLGRLLEAAVPGFDQFVTDNRYKKMLGFIHYNSFGVYFGKDGRDGRPAAKDAEYTRSAVGTDRQVGSAFYTLSAYLPHSCAPNVRATWPAGNTQLHLVAERDIKAGEELSVAYVRVGAIKVPEKTPVVVASAANGHADISVVVPEKAESVATDEHSTDSPVIVEAPKSEASVEESAMPQPSVDSSAQAIEETSAEVPAEVPLAAGAGVAESNADAVTEAIASEEIAAAPASDEAAAEESSSASAPVAEESASPETVPVVAEVTAVMESNAAPVTTEPVVGVSAPGVDYRLETPEECRVRRRVELMAGWQFDCTCTRCKEEAAESSA